MTGQRGPTAPTEGMPSPTQAKFTQPLSCPLWQLELEALFLVHLVVSGFGVQLLWKCFWWTPKKQVWIWGWSCQKVELRSTPLVWHYLELWWRKNKISDRVKSVRRVWKEQLKCHRWSHSCQLTWKQRGSQIHPFFPPEFLRIPGKCCFSQVIFKSERSLYLQWDEQACPLRDAKS